MGGAAPVAPQYVVEHLNHLAHISHPDSALFTLMGITRYPRQHHDLQQPREDIRQSPYPWYLGYDPTFRSGG